MRPRAPLRAKLWRDLRRLWAQGLAIALVMAAGVATLVLGTGAMRALEDTRAAYYAEYRFADLFADVTRAPKSLAQDVAALPGVLAVQTRIARLALLDMPDMAEPGTALMLSLPQGEGGGLNQLYLRQGRLPRPGAAEEAAISEGFAKAHGLQPGARFAVIAGGKRRSIQVTGVVLSPEFIYAQGPGDIIPDERRYGLLFMDEAALAALFDLEGAFTALSVKLAPGTAAPPLLTAIDRILAPYGGAGAYGRKDQLSHAFLEAELQQLAGMARVLPPIFLLVAAFLVNMTLTRLIALEREQIGLLKALGYGSAAIARHYLEFVLALASFGAALGLGAGTWLGAGLAKLYARFFHFPFLLFSRDPDIYALAVLVTFAAALMGAAMAVRRIAALPPAVAMAPPAPPAYRAAGGGLWAGLAPLRPRGLMVTRHLLHGPWRSGASLLGVALAVAVLVGSQWSQGSIDRMIAITFFQTERQDVSLAFARPLPRSALDAAARLPGVRAAEPFWNVPVRLSQGSIARRLALQGKPEGWPDLSRVLDAEGAPLALPPRGLVLSQALAEVLKLRPGDLVRVEMTEGPRRVFEARVAGISLGYLGLGAYASLPALAEMTGQTPALSGVHLTLDPAKEAAFFAAIKTMPQTQFLSSLTRTRANFRQTIAENIAIMTRVYITLAAIIAVGVVYNYARIALSEQGRELASLRVLGFTKGEVARVLYAELALIVLLAQPLGWLIGYGFALAIVEGFKSELYRVPLIIGPDVFARSSLIVLAAALGSALLIRGRIARLDMIEVLKTRE